MLASSVNKSENFIFSPVSSLKLTPFSVNSYFSSEKYIVLYILTEITSEKFPSTLAEINILSICLSLISFLLINSSNTFSISELILFCICLFLFILDIL